MRKLFTTLFFTLIATGMFGQWNTVAMPGERIRPETKVTNYYSLDINLLKSQLSAVSEASKGGSTAIITLPTLGGKMEKFAVYSAPVVAAELADKYDLGSYAGVSVSDATKFVRFSLSKNDFQSMVYSRGSYEFIEPQNNSKTVYGVFPKTNRTGKSFECGTNESFLSKTQLSNLSKSAEPLKQYNQFSKANDQKFRTYRLALSVTGEYTNYFGGVPQALTAINATLTRVNGIFEKDFAIRLILQNFPQLIYTDATTDPYSNASAGASGAWSLELQKTLTAVIGNDAYDIGHLFGRSGGGGSAGDVGNVCRNPENDNDDTSKGTAYTSPGSGAPAGDTFDIDYVAHELGHQFGADHTFSHLIQGPPYNTALMEPGSGSTIMGYAGITSANVQLHSDPYFHVRSIEQVQTYVNSQTCGTVTAIANTPPVVDAMPSKTIPKGTAFVLTATANDAQNDPLTYTWEEYDVAATRIVDVTANYVTGAKFRSLPPSTVPVRYFPKLSMVLAGTLGSAAEWESVSNVARTMNFRVTVRDNHPDVTQQQTAIGAQTITVSENGPFVITSSKVYNNVSVPLTWDVAGTNAAPFDAANVKVDYTLDNGKTWTILSASTPNDGSEVFNFAALPANTLLKMRISSIGNVFYAVAPVTVSVMAPCDGSAPTGVTVSSITKSSATVSWDPIVNATYILRYKKATDATWAEIRVAATSHTLVGLAEDTAYNVQVAAICSGTTGIYSSVTNFTTLMLTYCALTASDAGDEYISNVTITAQGAAGVNSTSAASTYTNYTSDATRLVTLKQGTTGNVISVTKAWTGDKYDEAVTVWIDFDRSGTYDSDEIIMVTAANIVNPATSTFAVPADAYIGDKTVGMRVALSYDSAQMDPCGTYIYGEVEDYAVKIIANMSVNDSGKANGVQVYPNPAIDVLNITKVSDRASYTIYNMAGQAVLKGKVANNKVQVSQLEKGVYVIAVDHAGEVSKLKFIKK